MRIIILFVSVLSFFAVRAQNLPVNCNLAVPGCTTPSFNIEGQQPPYDVEDFGSGTTANPGNNPGSGNSGCLLTGETVSTFITISVSSNGTLEWSMIGDSGFGCFDWIMWNVSGQPANNLCAGINGNTLGPVRCNWNGSCNGNTGMAPSGNLPPGGSQSSYEPPLNVLAGETYVLCLSNYSGTDQEVDLNFFGSATVTCDPSAPDQTICLGSSATVTIATPGFINPQFEWLTTNGVSNPTGGTGVIVTPTVTTTYTVEVTQPASGGNPEIVATLDFTITVVPPPVPNAGPDHQICLGSTVQFNGVPGIPGDPCTWQVLLPVTTPPATAPFSPNPNSLNVTSTPSQPGVYRYILRENNPVCGMRRDTAIVTVSQLLLTNTVVNPSCEGGSDGQVTLNAPGAAEYSFDNGVTWGTSPTNTGLTEGTYNYCARSALGCQKCQAITLVDPAPVVVSVSNDTLICQNGTATLMASATGGTSYTYTWDHTAATGVPQMVSPLANTTYTVVATNESGCPSAPASIDVSVREPISAVISPVQSVCPGYPGTINVVATEGIGSPYTFVWSTGANETGMISSITESPLATTTYSVTITDGCESTPLVVSSDLVAYPLPVPAIEVADNLLCEPAYFTIENRTEPDSLSDVTYWRLSDGQEFFNMDQISPDSLYSGDYDVTLVVTSPQGCIDSLTFANALNVLPTPIPDFRWSPDPVQMFNTEVLFSNYSQGAVSYNWIFEGATPGSSNSENTFSTFPDGVAASYDVTLTATSDYGCVASITKTVVVLPEVLIFAPNAFTPDGDEFNQSWRVFLEGVDPFEFELLVYNRWGEVVWESQDIEGSWDGTYHGEIMPAGVYTWTIRTKDRLSDGKYTWQGWVSLIR